MQALTGSNDLTLVDFLASLPSAGEVRLDGRAIAGPSPDRGVIFQQYALFPWLTVSQNIEFGLTIKHTPKLERDAIVRKCLDLVGLGQFAHALPKTLSGGMTQRCAIARAYAVNPQILLRPKANPASRSCAPTKSVDLRRRIASSRHSAGSTRSRSRNSPHSRPGTCSSPSSSPTSPTRVVTC
jgi:ABC-type transporter Mla maintaining outer membrane lipid asymmetry ATPase subunit MlaF